MRQPIYIHYGATLFNPSKNFPIRNRQNSNKPLGGLWASRQDATFGWKKWCERERFTKCDDKNSFIFRLSDDSKVAFVHNRKDLDCLATYRHSVTENKIIDFEESLRRGYDAIELCWYGNEYQDKNIDNMHFILYGWDCDSIIVLNPSAIITI